MQRQTRAVFAAISCPQIPLNGLLWDFALAAPLAMLIDPMTQQVRRLGRISTAHGPRLIELRGEQGLVLDDGWQPTGESVPLDNAQWLIPTAPSKIIGIGKNYRAHAAEMGGGVPDTPLIFLKPPSSLIADGGVVELPAISQRVDYEAELGVVIGKRCRRVSEQDALDYVAGYLPVCDVTARDLQRSDGQWSRAKGFDTFCPVGPFMVQGVEPGALDIQLSVNGQLKQSGNTRDMVFNVAQLIAHISSAMTLEPGDLIATGTPEGVGPLAPDDQVQITIQDVGGLTFGVAAEA